MAAVGGSLNINDYNREKLEFLGSESTLFIFNEIFFRSDFKFKF